MFSWRHTFQATLAASTSLTASHARRVTIANNMASKSQTVHVTQATTALVAKTLHDLRPWHVVQDISVLREAGMRRDAHPGTSNPSGSLQPVMSAQQGPTVKLSVCKLVGDIYLLFLAFNVVCRFCKNENNVLI